MVGDRKRAMKAKQIRDDLLEQLDEKSGQYHLDLIGDYMEFWNTKCLLQADVREHGVRIQYVNGRGETAEKKNDSVDQLLKVNAQMIRILQELGIKPRLKPVGEDDAL